MSDVEKFLAELKHIVRNKTLIYWLKVCLSEKHFLQYCGMVKRRQTIGYETVSTPLSQTRTSISSSCLVQFYPSDILKIWGWFLLQ